MNTFSVHFLNPFIKEEQKLGIFSGQQIVEEFTKIKWYKNIMDCFYIETNTAPNDYVLDKDRTTVEHLHSHFSVASSYLGKNILLFVMPNFASDSSFEENDIRFSIEYMRPKKEKTSKLARFFGASAEKINNEYISHKKEITYKETIQILTALGNENKDLLEKEIDQYGTIF